MAYLTLRVPKPKAFLCFMSLRTGTTLIMFTILINKLSGVYGLLALFTGFHVSALQLSMYLYSICALALAAFLAPHIRRQSPLECLALAWFYLLDSIVNAAYTAAFGAAWFTVLAWNSATALPGGSGAIGGAAGTIDDTSGFTDPEFNVTHVDVVPPNPGSGPTGVSKEAHLVGHAGVSSDPTLTSAIFQSGSMASVIVITSLWLVRIYFILIVMAYARGVLRQYIIQASHGSGQPLASSSVDSGRYADDPFAEGKELGPGWKGKLGRLMVQLGRSYWLGADEDGESVPRVFNRGAGKGSEGGAAASSTTERERRRRAGTGPPVLRPIELKSVRKA